MHAGDVFVIETPGGGGFGAAPRESATSARVDADAAGNEAQR